MVLQGRHTTYWLIYVMFLDVIQGYSLTMITEGQKYVCSAGDSVILLCDFHAQEYNLFDYPVLWKKQQHDEVIQVNIMGNLNDPFVATKRFQVSFSQDVPMHRFELFITDVAPEDSGNYTCEVRGPESVIITTVTHYVYVRAPIQALILTAANDTVNSTRQDELRHSRHLTMIANTLNPLRCVALGGYPAPLLMVTLGKDDITRQLRYSSTTLLTGEPGLRVITYTTEVWTDSFMVNPDDDGAKLKCVAPVSGRKPHSVTLTLDVHYSPKIICHGMSVYAWERNAVLKCEVWSKPDTNTLFWIIDSNGTTLSVGEVINEFWISILDKDDDYLETRLFMHQARPEDFRTYTIVAENSVAAASRKVDLFQKYRSSSQMPDRGKSVRNPSRQSGDGYMDSSAISNCFPAVSSVIKTLMYSMWILWW